MEQIENFGAWQVEKAWTPDLAAGLEEAGYRILWIGGSVDSDLGVGEELLAATKTVTVATGILNVWSTDSIVVARSFHRLEDRFPGRFLLGIGAGHRERAADRYAKPYTAVSEYLDRLDANGVPADRRVLAALGDRMIGLAAARARGAHPYLTTPAHTAHARELLGAEPFLAPEQKIVLHPDDEAARSIGRPFLDPYLHRANYLNSFKRMGYSDEDLINGGSDRLIDDIVLHGTAADVATRLPGHRASGADHVAVQVLPRPDHALIDEYWELAQSLDLVGTPI